MKTKFTITICALLMSSLTIGQDICSKYYPFKEGITFQITTYNNKGKKNAVVDYEITAVKNNVATFNTKISDEKGKEITTSNYNITCDGNGISIDFKSIMNPELFAQYKDMEMELTGTNIDIPNNLSVGQSLKDADMVMTVKMAGLNMEMNMKLLNRKVDDKESITTSAGTFDCYVISYTIEFKMGIKQTNTAKDWIAEGVGMVKSETYNKNGKLMGYSELTNLTK